MNPFDRITLRPDRMNGQPCVRDLRLTVRRVLEALAMYPDRADLFRQYPELEPDDVRQVLAFNAAAPSVIRIRIEGMRGSEIATTVSRVVDVCEPDLVAGAMVTVDPQSVRVRRLPLVT